MTNLLILTMYSNTDIVSCRNSNAIICSTSVTSCILSTDGPRKFDNSGVVRSICPDNAWIWISRGFTVQGQIGRLSNILVRRDIGDYWWNCEAKETELTQ